MLRNYQGHCLPPKPHQTPNPIMAPINFGMALNIFQFLRLGMGTASLPQPKPSIIIYQGLSLFQLWTKPHMASGPRMGFTGNKLEWVPTSEMVVHAKVEWPGSNPVAVPLKVLKGHMAQFPRSLIFKEYTKHLQVCSLPCTEISRAIAYPLNHTKPQMPNGPDKFRYGPQHIPISEIGNGYSNSSSTQTQ